jgi:hypothetical protein
MSFKPILRAIEYIRNTWQILTLRTFMNDQDSRYKTVTARKQNSFQAITQSKQLKPLSQQLQGSSPQSTILQGFFGRSVRFVSSDSSFLTTSSPSITCPNTTWRLSNHGVCKYLESCQIISNCLKNKKQNDRLHCKVKKMKLKSCKWLG